MAFEPTPAGRGAARLVAVEMDHERMRRLVADARVARLATVGPDGAPHLVPLCFALDGEVVYWAVDHKPKRSTRLRRVDNLRADPRCSLLVDHYDEDWTRLWWVRLDARARVVDDVAERARALALLAAKYPQYQVTPPRGALLAVRVERWLGWSAGEPGG
jgi:PPOX class probable F420-dependent enzyme